MGEYFVITDATFTDIRKKITYSQWEAEKTPKENFDTVCTTLTQIFECTINNDYHTGSTKTGQGGFVYLT